MYYNSDKNSNDYYSAYKEEINHTSLFQENHLVDKRVKLGVTTLILALITVGAFYFFNYFATDRQQNRLASTAHQTAQESSNVHNIEHLGKESINATTASSNIHPKDIELIVKIIMSQMKKAPQDKVSPPTETLEQQLVDAQKQVVEQKTLEESNHYNKVLVSSDEPVSNELMQLQSNLNHLFEEKSEKYQGSDYAKAISKEVSTRSNEMTIIVVQKGDTLSKIAKKVYGKGDDYVKIYNANPEIVKNPNQIYAGQRLRIPA